MGSQYLKRLIVFSLTIHSLAVAILSFFNAHTALILNDRARSDYTSGNSFLAKSQFRLLTDLIIITTQVTSLGVATLTIYGLTVMALCRGMPRSELMLGAAAQLVFGFAALQLLVTLTLLVLGAHQADHVSALQTIFAKFGAKNNIPLTR